MILAVISTLKTHSTNTGKIDNNILFKRETYTQINKQHQTILKNSQTIHTFRIRIGIQPEPANYHAVQGFIITVHHPHYIIKKLTNNLLKQKYNQKNR